ncbi:MAG TPA: precorrin-3B C(17)-methyltransferase [Lachnospiraceae bacterium]|nr:precorrin-3B C(17)-methyltransferase [Lachnospiraceae bacterium]
MLNIVGFGPGGYEGMTIEAEKALEKSELIIGYTTYIELIRPYFPKKEYMQTGMHGEADRCRLALAEAGSRMVALVCSGDSGVYGMAGLVYELAGQMEEGRAVPEINVIAGVTAAVSGGAVLGAPLSNDFMTISLSDLLTPLTIIKKRICCAAESDTVLCLYNPSSRKRTGYLKMACELVLEYQSPDTVCGYVQNINRNGQKTVITTLENLKEMQVDMFTTVFIGNSSTRNINGKMVTARGYRYV